MWDSFYKFVLFCIEAVTICFSIFIITTTYQYNEKANSTQSTVEATVVDKNVNTTMISSGIPPIMRTIRTYEITVNVGTTEKYKITTDSYTYNQLQKGDSVLVTLFINSKNTVVSAEFAQSNVEAVKSSE